MFQSNDRDTTQNVTTIGQQMKISGTLASDGNVLFDGTLEKGTIRIGGHLTVGGGAYIKGEVEARKLVVNGKIEGNVSVKEDLEIGEAGAISGDITVQGKLIINKGGVFNGKCTMGTSMAESTDQPTTRRTVKDKKEIA